MLVTVSVAAFRDARRGLCMEPFRNPWQLWFSVVFRGFPWFSMAMLVSLTACNGSAATTAIPLEQIPTASPTPTQTPLPKATPDKDPRVCQEKGFPLSGCVVVNLLPKGVKTSFRGVTGIAVDTNGNIFGKPQCWKCCSKAYLQWRSELADWGG